MDSLLDICTRIFDSSRTFWHRESTHKTVSSALILLFLASLVVIEFSRQGWLPGSLGSQTFLPEFHAVFRNSGYALATLLIRVSLTAPVYFNVLIGLASVVLALLLTLIYNRFYIPNPQGD